MSMRFTDLRPSLRARRSLTGAAALLALAACSSANAQDAASDVITTQASRDDWVLPPGASVTISRTTGNVRYLLPSEFAPGERSRYFGAWRKTPYSGTGPFPATRAEDTTLQTNTLYFPRDLKSAPKLPIVLFANGGCRNTSVEFTRFLGEIASWGYLVVAVGRNDVPFYERPSDAPADLPPPLPSTTPGDASSMIAGLDWAVAENGRRGSKFYRKLDTQKVAALGQSCGGTQAFAAARDDRVRTVVALNSHFPTPQAAGGMGVVDPSWTAEALTKPGAFFIGGPADSAYMLSMKSWEALPPDTAAVRANLPDMGHTGAYGMPDPRWTGAVTAWLDWQLKGSESARSTFAGPECGLCTNSDWWIDARNINPTDGQE